MSMTKRVECVARAIAKCRGLDPDANLSYGEKPAWQYFVDDAEAAISAVALLETRDNG